MDLWEIDRVTYRENLMQPMVDKRIKYIKFMRNTGTQDDPSVHHTL